MSIQLLTLFGLLGAASLSAADVSYFKDVRPLLAKNCMGCHRPEKSKGKLDLTTYESFKRGGKEGAGFIAGRRQRARQPDENK